jgi:glycosyltransferase involved in cell wall biosynthesis
MPNVNEPKRRCVLILDLSATGHHPTYVRWLLESDVAKSSTMILASRKEMFTHAAIKPLSGTFAAHEIDISPQRNARLKQFSAKSLLFNSWDIGHLYRKTFALLSRTMPIDFVIVPFLDDCLLGLSLPRAAFGKTPWMAITMRTMFHFGEMGVRAPPQKFTSFRRFLFHRVLKQKSATSIMSVDATLVDYGSQQIRPGYKKLEYLPDPSADPGLLIGKVQARQDIGIPEGASVVLLYGEIAARKGIAELMEAAADSSCSTKLHVLLAGRCDNPSELLGTPAIRKLLLQGRLHRIDGYLDNIQEQAALAASDCVWVGYKDFYLMSGVLVLAGRHGLGVLASSNGLIGYLTDKHHLGIHVDVRDKSSIVEALNSLVQQPESFARSGKNGIDVFRKHRPAEFQRLFSEKATQSWS